MQKDGDKRGYFLQSAYTWCFDGQSWKKKYGGVGIAELRRLRQLEEENAKLKQLVADLSLDKQMLQDILKKKL